MTPDPGSEALRERAESFLSGHHVATLATQGAEGPWAAAVFYANDGLELIFVSSPRSRHAGDVAASARAAAAIHDNCADWRQIKGIQLEGSVRELVGTRRERARQLYAQRFPMIAAIGGAPAAIATALARVRWYLLTPTRLCLLDNEKSFGHRECIDLSPDASRTPTTKPARARSARPR